MLTGSADGTGSSAGFYSTSGVAVDASGNVYVSDWDTIRKVTSLGVVTTLAHVAFLGSGDFTGGGLAADTTGNLYVADHGTISKVSTTGVVTTFSGNASLSGSADGTSTSARFHNPCDVAVDSTGNVYVADAGNHAIRKIDAGGNVTTIGGVMGSKGSSNGSKSAARFNSPQGVTVDAAGNVYVADTGNCLIRKITASDLTVSTVAGAVFTGSEALPGRGGFSGNITGLGGLDGTGTGASFSFPVGIKVDGSGNLYVTDTGIPKIRKITSGGVVTTIGGGSDGFLCAPYGIAINSSGRLYVADNWDDRIAVGVGPSSSCKCDFNGDGIPDILLENGTSLGVWCPDANGNLKQWIGMGGGFGGWIPVGN